MLLLDTHAYLWFVNGDPSLSDSAIRQIQTSEKVYVSIATFWEMAIKSSLGKLDLPTSIDQMIEDCKGLGLSILPIEGSHLVRLKELPWIHRDPFDRLLICQAQVENLTLVTTDGNIVKYDVSTLWSK